MQILVHPISGTTILDVQLSPGTTIGENDKYDSTDGKWRENGWVAGLTIQPGCTTIWVRQPDPLSDNARTLLSYLNLHGGDSFGCIGERNGTLYVIPSPLFNWDSRIMIESQRIQHPECVQELVDHACLVFDGVVYTLTDEGKREGALLLANN